MVSQSKTVVAGLLSFLWVVQGARIQRRSAAAAAGMTIAGVPVHKHSADKQEWILLFKKGTSDASIARVCGGKCGLVGHPDKKGVAFAQVNSYVKMEQIAREHGGELELIEADTMYSMIPEIEGEVGAAASWGLDAVGAPGRAFTGQGVHIYVQDTGINKDHKDFGGRVIPTLDLTNNRGKDLCAESPDARCSADGQGHGTHCAGSAAGSTLGVASEATIHAVKTLSDEGSGPESWQITAIDWVVTNGQLPAVLSMSLGGSGVSPGFETTIATAVDAGVVVVVAAGNSNLDSCSFSPAFAASAITVGATTVINARASYSNYGSCNQIMAPGSAIVSASHTSNTGTRSLSGTSMACPHVSGAAALLLQGNPSMTSPEILASMLATARTGLISGLNENDPDALLWVSAVDAPAPTPAPPSACDPTFSSGPDTDNDCRCSYGFSCYQDGSRSCDYSFTEKYGTRSTRWFLATCGTSCVCK